MLKPLPINLTDVERKTLIYSGIINNVYTTDRPGIHEVESTDSLYLEKSRKVENVPGKSVTNNTISIEIFRTLERNGIPTHFASEGTTSASRFVLKTTPIPLKVIARFEATGDFCERYNCPPGTTFDEPFIEFAYKNDAKGDQPIDHKTIAVFLKQYQLENKKEIYLLDYYTARIAKLLEEFWLRFNIQLVDFTAEYGRLTNGSIILCRELSLDTCHLYDNKTCEAVDSDHFSKARLNLYNDFFSRMNLKTT